MEWGGAGWRLRQMRRILLGSIARWNGVGRGRGVPTSRKGTPIPAAHSLRCSFTALLIHCAAHSLRCSFTALLIHCAAHSLRCSFTALLIHCAAHLLRCSPTALLTYCAAHLLRCSLTALLTYCARSIALAPRFRPFSRGV